jgi:hypothetical protein
MLLETLVSLGNTDEGRMRLLSDYRKPLLELIGLFVQQFERIVERGQEDADGEEEEEYSAAGNVRKCMGLFYRLYGALHRGGAFFAESLREHFTSSRGATKLRAHFRMFLGHPLLRDNEIIDAEDVEAFASLALAARSHMDNGADGAGFAIASSWAPAQTASSDKAPADHGKKPAGADSPSPAKRQRMSLAASNQGSHYGRGAHRGAAKVDVKEKSGGEADGSPGKKRRVKAQAALAGPRGNKAIFGACTTMRSLGVLALVYFCLFCHMGRLRVLVSDRPSGL